MEAFSLSAFLVTNICGLFAIVVLPWVMYAVFLRKGVSPNESGGMFVRTTLVTWFGTPIIVGFFAIDTPGYTPLELGQMLLSCFFLYLTGTVMAAISGYVFFAINDKSHSKRSNTNHR